MMNRRSMLAALAAAVMAPAAQATPVEAPEPMVSVLDYMSPQQIQAWDAGEVVDLSGAVQRAVASGRTVHIPRGRFVITGVVFPGRRR